MSPKAELILSHPETADSQDRIEPARRDAFLVECKDLWKLQFPVKRLHALRTRLQACNCLVNRPIDGDNPWSLRSTLVGEQLDPQALAFRCLAACEESRNGRVTDQPRK